MASAGRALACLRVPSIGEPTPTAAATGTIFWNGGDEIAINGVAQVNITYSDIFGGWPGQGNIAVDPLFAAPVPWDPNMADDPNDGLWLAGDYHLRSQGGRWDPNSRDWVIDEATSPCIDAGDPAVPAGQEPQPNGGRINMGVYGGTIEASRSRVPRPAEAIVAAERDNDAHPR